MTLPSWNELAVAENRSYEAALWGSAESQQARFYRALHHVQLHDGMGPGSLLDYGCGTGEFCEYLGGSWYTGIDAAPPMVDRARLAHGDEQTRFIVGTHPPLPGTDAGRPHGQDPWRAAVGAALPTQYEAVVALGTFNLRRDYTKSQTANAIEDLWLLTARVLCVSVLRRPAAESNDWGVDELVEIVEGFLEEPSSFTIDCWKQNDAMLVCRKS